MGELIILFVVLKNKTFFLYLYFYFSSTAYFSIISSNIQKSDTSLDKANTNFNNQRSKGILG